MPISVELRENGRVLYILASDPLPIEEFEGAYIPQKQYLDQSPHKLHALVNFSLHKNPPRGALGSGRDIPFLTHPNRGEGVIVGASLMLQLLAGAVARLQRFNRLTFFETEEEAWNYIRGIINNSQTNGG